MIMNYNEWFNKYHRYLTGTRDGVTTYNDTKWRTLNERYQTLIDLNSQLIDQQPFGIAGNYTGFQQLLELMKDSSYTFQDLNRSLIDTYQISLQNAMSRMLVNTHAVVANVKYGETKSISVDKFGNYIVDVPYDQLHFGGRDEFIRQNLHMMYETENQHYIPEEEFFTESITKMLGFTLMCCVNGYMVNGWSVGVDEKGFRFQIPWKQTADPNFIIYKLDASVVTTAKEVPFSYVNDNTPIPLTYFDQSGLDDMSGAKCIIEIYDAYRPSGSRIVPNFGLISNGNLEMLNVQKRTLDDLKYQNASMVTLRVYILKYLHEIRNVFPAFNYYDMMGTRVTYDDQGNHITNGDGKKIHLQETEVSSNYDICTPPISIDHQSATSYTVLTDACRMVSTLETVTYPMVSAIGKKFNDCQNANDIIMYVKNPAAQVRVSLESAYNSYLKAAITTSMIPQDKIHHFESMIQKFRTLEEAPATVSSIQSAAFDELFGDSFKTMFIDDVVTPLNHEPFTTMQTIIDYTPNYFTNRTLPGTTRFNRPISEQCFIVMEYLQDEQCWVFSAPNIRHMNGIGNTFYIADGLKGYEIFKFFFLYTETENPSELYTNTLSYDETIDFDLFTEEVKRHMGYIRYWNIESRLTKLSEMVYQDANDETKINILSKILKRKLDDPTFMEYPSDMNFELSNVTSDNIGAGEYDFRAPFSLNFLFYTVRMMYDNKDQLLSYFVQSLMDRKFHPRYSDLKVSEIPSDDAPMISVNYARITEGPLSMTEDIQAHSVLSTDDSVKLYAGVPFALDASDHVIDIPMYPYTYTQTYSVLPLLNHSGVDMEYHLTDPSAPVVHSAYDDGKIASMVSVFAAELMNQFADLQAYYKADWNQEARMKAIRALVTHHKEKIEQYINDRGDDYNPMFPETFVIVEAIEGLEPNDVLHENMLETSEHMHYYTPLPGKPGVSLHYIISTILMMLQKVFDLTGFDHDATRRLRALYLHMKKLEYPMGLQEFHDWADEFDLNAYKEIPNSYPDNPNVLYYADRFNAYTPYLTYFIGRIKNNSELLMNTFNVYTPDGSAFINSPIIETICAYLNVMKEHVFDLFMIDQIRFTSSTYNTEPAYAVISMNWDNDHVNPPFDDSVSGDCNILLHPIYENTGSGYQLKKLVPVCPYAFFNGDTATTTINLYNKSNTLITTISNVTVTFKKVARSIDGLPNVMQYVSSYSLPLNVLNVHETFDTTADDIINQKHAELNYEILAGNQFMPLSHFSEFQSDQEGPYDKLYIPCDFLNSCSVADRQYQDVAMWFKPCMIYHPPTDSYNAYGGKYRIGETVYAATTDGLSVFPMKLRAVTHGETKGFIEAFVDEHHAKWFRTTDPTVMETYLTAPVDCKIVDDNFRNFLDEFSNGGPIPENLSEMFDTKAHLIYIGSTQLETDDRDIIVKMINHNFNPYSVEELYPILRTEPDDHSIWDEERRVFNEEISKALVKGAGLAAEIRNLAMQMSYATTREERINLQIQIDNLRSEMDYENAFIKRMQYYLEQLETPTTWYNVYAYDDALVYINNGRAHLSRTFQPAIRDLSYTDNVQVRLYDWETKQWIDQSEYTVTPVEVATDIDDVKDVEVPSDVMTTLNITFSSPDYQSRKILIYFMYEDSDVFDSITVNDDVTFSVRFRPVFSSSTFGGGSDDPYDGIRIRKHYDANETYPVKILESSLDVFGQAGYLVKRVERNGTYTNGSTLRLCHLSVIDGANTYDASDFDLYTKHPFPNTTVPQKTDTKSYQVNISQLPDGFEAGHDITLVCVQNDATKYFDGTLSNIMFHATTSGVNTITVDSDTLPIGTPSGQYVCTVIPNESHPITGGLLTIGVTVTPIVSSPSSNDWIRIPSDAPYRIIPNEFVMIPHGVTLSDDAILILQNQYELDTSHDVSEDNLNVDDPFTIYYDTLYHVRYPIANIRKQKTDKRLVINRTTNTNVETIKTNYIGISRYVAQEIPRDGIIDLTGYIPTPLSRSRYEFWVNGRYVSNPDQLIILSPTTFQLRNMTSLRNLEVIELVDDMTDSLILPKGTVYVDINGKMYSDYKLAVLRNANIVDQSINYQFGVNTYSKMDVYLPDVNRNANNIDLEPDILSYIQIPDPTSYNELNHIPSINGEKIYNATSYSLGFREIPAIEILRQFDKTWKRERFDGVVSMQHSTDRYTLDQQTQTLHVVKTDDGYLIYTSGINTYTFTLYISDLENGEIDDTTHTTKVIPMIHSGVVIKLDNTYQGQWLHSTIKNSTPIQLT